MTKKNPRREYTAKDLKGWRSRMDYSVDVAASELGCSPQSIYNWESGESEMPRYIGLACDALALGLGGDEREAS